MVNFYYHDLLTSWFIKVQHATIQRAKIGPLVPAEVTNPGLILALSNDTPKGVVVS